MGLLPWVGVFALAFAVSWVAVRGIRSVAPRLNLVDFPNERSLHSTPTARGGGLTVVLVALAGGALIGWAQTSDWQQIAAYVLGGLLIATVGFIDDLRGLSPLPKLAIQVAAAICLVVGLGQHVLSLDLWLPGLIVLIVAVFLTVTLTNIYNFMDGSDGLAATQGVMAGLGWTLVAVSGGRFDLALLSLVVAAGCLGFLAHNLPPASIFMGDVGSAFLGFTFAFLPFALARDGIQLFAGLLMIWPFVFDASLTIGRRIVRRQNILQAHREHLYQRLVLAGWTPRSVLLLYGLFSLESVGLAAAWWDAPAVLRALVLALFVVSAAALWNLVARREAQAANRSVTVH